MSYKIFSIVVLLAAFCATAVAQRDPNCSLPKPGRHVTDNANLLSRPTRQYLEQKLVSLRTGSKIEVAVVAITSTGSESAVDYAVALANCWGIGDRARSNGGVLLFIARGDREWRIQVSRKLERRLPNAKVREIGDRMAGYFKREEYDRGVGQTVDDLIYELQTGSAR